MIPLIHGPFFLLLLNIYENLSDLKICPGLGLFFRYILRAKNVGQQK